MLLDFYFDWSWIIPICGGIYCTLLGFKIVPRIKSEEHNKWYSKFGKSMRWMGPFIFLFGVLNAFKIL
jgi:hypothetical protein